MNSKIEDELDNMWGIIKVCLEASDEELGSKNYLKQITSNIADTGIKLSRDRVRSIVYCSYFIVIWLSERIFSKILDENISQKLFELWEEYPVNYELESKKSGGLILLTFEAPAKKELYRVFSEELNNFSEKKLDLGICFLRYSLAPSFMEKFKLRNCGFAISEIIEKLNFMMTYLSRQDAWLEISKQGKIRE